MGGTMSPMPNTPDAADMARRACGEGEWRVPVELVMACSSSSVVKGHVLKRVAAGEYPRPAALVIQRGNRFFATVEFPGLTRPACFIPLDVWTMESFRAGEGRL
jgi:hypothetical protein